jgi:hypothetical protein
VVSSRDGFFGEAMEQQRLDEPVVVLTCARSGSTLLRFILDAHPALACPPETSITDLCSRMGIFSMLLDGPSSTGRPALGDEALISIRIWVTATYSSYLARAGKVRWCDKSLGSAESAGRFLELFPKAKFICLYRHSMDVVGSLIEACPYGLRGYGLEPFAAAHSGNSVAAAADYWLNQTNAIADFEQQHPDSCLRVRYEELVANPEVQAARIFSFLGEEQMPSITSACFAGDREQFGPSDHKIWDTTGVHTDSVGQGARVPVAVMAKPLLEPMNTLLERLGYQPVGEYWNSVPVSVLADQQGQDAAAVDGQAEVLNELDALLVPRIAGRLADMSSAPARVREVGSSVTFTAAAPAGGTALSTRSWRVDLATAAVSRNGTPDPKPDPRAWAVIGDAGDWTAVLTGRLSLATALRRGCLRLAVSPTAGPETGGRPLPPSLRFDLHLAVLRWLLRSAPGNGDAPGDLVRAPGRSGGGPGPVTKEPGRRRAGVPGGRPPG